MPMSGEALQLASPRGELSIYLHLPFCKHQCPYCHFYVVKNDPPGHAAFVDRMIQEFYFYLPRLNALTLRSIYLGGGTPSLVAPTQLSRLIQAIMQALPSHPHIEITLEANPETITPSTLSQWQEARINRLSVGIQSLEEDELLALGRGHGSSLAKGSLKMIAESGFTNYSLDLMIETPRQTLASWQRTLHQIIDHPPTHLSLYNLVIEPGTAYAKREKALKKQIVDSEIGLLMLQQASSALPHAGLQRYEISAFAKPGYESVHNTGYWRGRTFLGIGPSAYSFMDGIRFQNAPDINLWSQAIDKGQSAVNLIDELKAEVRQAELLAVQLRLMAGVDLDSFCERWGPLSEELVANLLLLKKRNWIIRTGQLLKLTDQGALFYEQVAQELIILPNN